MGYSMNDFWIVFAQLFRTRTDKQAEEINLLEADERHQLSCPHLCAVRKIKVMGQTALPDAMVIVVAQMVCNDLQWSTAVRKLLREFILATKNQTLSCLQAPAADVTSFLYRDFWVDENVVFSPIGSPQSGFAATTATTATTCCSACCFNWSRFNCARRWRQCLNVPMAKQANLVNEYLHIGSQTSMRLKLITIAAAREKHSPAFWWVREGGRVRMSQRRR